MVSRRPPSFFKLLLDPSAHHLPLPPDFVCMHLKNKLPKGPIVLQCGNGCHLWRLKIEKIGENYCFTHGWNNVVQDKDLGFGDFLVIWFAKKSTFKMLVYSPNGCEKIMPLKEHAVVPQKEHVEHVVVDDDCNEGDGDGVDGGDGDPSFVKIMSKTHKNRLRLPAHFNGLPGIAGEGSIIMKSLNGKECRMVSRMDRSFRNSERYMLISGWSKFFRSNNLSIGDECLFKFIRSEGKMHLAKVTKNKWPTMGSKSLFDESETLATSGSGGGGDGDADVANENEYVDVVKKPRPHQDSNFVYF